MQYSLTTTFALLSTLLALTSAAPANLSARATYWIDSTSGNTPIGDCSYTNYWSHIWDICTETGCPGTWESLGQINLPCIPIGGGENSGCAELEPEYFCRRVSGGYNGWGARNGMLNAFFGFGYCWDDGNWAFVGGKATREWTALRGSDGGWINVEFKTGINGC